MSGSSNGSADWIQKNGSGGDSAQQSEAIEENDCKLPLANVVQIMKKTLPDEVKISKEAKDMVQEWASDYVTFITSEVSQKCLREKSKEINEDDILFALSSLASYGEVVNREDVVTIQHLAETPDVTPSQTTCLGTACKVKTNSSG